MIASGSARPFLQRLANRVKNTVFPQPQSSSFPGRPPDWPKTRAEFEDFWEDTSAVSQYLHPSRLELYAEVAQLVPAKAHRVLDLGCGGGHFLRYLADQRRNNMESCVLVGVDYAQSAIDLASRLVPEATFLRALASDTRFPDNTFDAVVCMEVLEHLKKPRLALLEAWRVLAPGGHLIVTIPDGAQDRWTGHEHRWSEGQFRSFLGRLPVKGLYRLEAGRTLAFVLQKGLPATSKSQQTRTPIALLARIGNRILKPLGFALVQHRPRPVFLSDLGRWHYQCQAVGRLPDPGAKVLDVGSGHYPFPYATILGDLNAGSTPHRTEPLRRDSRPLVVFDIHHMPFADRSIDFVYCSHVLEHVADPQRACAELMRVGKRGYIEVPTFAKDILFGWASGMHRWHIHAINNKLVFFEYTPRQAMGMQSSTWRDVILGPNYHPLQTAFYDNEDLFNIQFTWDGSFECVVYRLDQRSGP